jgi:hypothetical protein
LYSIFVGPVVKAACFPPKLSHLAHSCSLVLSRSLSFNRTQAEVLLLHLAQVATHMVLFPRLMQVDSHAVVHRGEDEDKDEEDEDKDEDEDEDEGAFNRLPSSLVAGLSLPRYHLLCRAALLSVVLLHLRTVLRHMMA